MLTRRRRFSFLSHLCLCIAALACTTTVAAPCWPQGVLSLEGRGTSLGIRPDKSLSAAVIDVQRTGTRVLLEVNAGQRDGVKKDWLMVVGDGGTFIGNLRITEVEADRATGELTLEDAARGQAQIGQKAYAIADPSHTSEALPGIHISQTYFGVNRPVMIEVVSPRSFGRVALVIMNHAGEIVLGPAEIVPGRHNLAEILPGIWELERAAYLQLVAGSEPIGSALVIAPMLARMVPQTQTAYRPDGITPYPRIVGWLDENTPPPTVPPPTAASSGANASPATPTSTESPEKPTDPTSADQPDEPAHDDEAKGGDPPTADSSTSTPAEPPPPPTEPKPMVPMRPMLTAEQHAAEEAHAAKRLCSGLRIWREEDVIIKTSLGEIRIALRPDAAPNTALNFLELARGGFYTGVIFHRVVPLDRNGLPFVIQAGDPTGTGDGGPGYWLPMEQSDLPHDLGVISMARADDPDSAGSQFFIALSREGTARLDGQYCAFGYAVREPVADARVNEAATGPLDVIRAIAQVQLADPATGRPVDPPVIESMEIVDAPPRTPGKGRPDTWIGAPEAQPERKPTNGRVPR